MEEKDKDSRGFVKRIDNLWYHRYGFKTVHKHFIKLYNRTNYEAKRYKACQNKLRHRRLKRELSVEYKNNSSNDPTVAIHPNLMHSSSSRVDGMSNQSNHGKYRIGKVWGRKHGFRKNFATEYRFRKKYNANFDALYPPHTP
jgi:hypothetical protein